jgi:hypothetical protein
MLISQMIEQIARAGNACDAACLCMKAARALFSDKKTILETLTHDQTH